jgi:hypothetical protein
LFTAEVGGKLVEESTNLQKPQQKMVEAAGIEPAKRCRKKPVKRGFIGVFEYCLGNEWKRNGVLFGGNWWKTVVSHGGGGNDTRRLIRSSQEYHASADQR